MHAVLPVVERRGEAERCGCAGREGEEGREEKKRREKLDRWRYVRWEEEGAKR